MSTRGKKPNAAEARAERTAVEAPPGLASAPSAAPVNEPTEGRALDVKPSEGKAPSPPRPRRRRPEAPLDSEPPTLPPEETAPLAAASAAAVGEAPPARIEYVSPDGKENIRDLLGSTTVGRHTDNDIQLLDPEVSKHHLVIEEVGGLYVLKDLGSANGTVVNGEVRGTAGLEDGDLIEVGNTTLRFCLHRSASKQATVTDPPAPDDSVPSEFFDSTGPVTGPFDPFEQMLSGKHTASGEPERTTVTLVPGFGPEPETNVFALPMEEDFARADDIEDERQLRRDYERLRVAYDLSLEVGLQTDLGALGETLLARIGEVLPADTAVVMLRGPGGELVPLASRVEGPATDEVRIPRAIVEQVMSSKEGMLTSDAQADAALRSSHTVVGQRIRSALCVPLLLREEVYGVIHLSSSSAAGAYEERDLSLLRAIAQPAALAVANARLVQRVEDDARTRAQLSRFLSPALVERVVEQDLSLGAGGDKVLCTVLFSDIRGFTSMSEGQNPEAVVRMLNEYFEAMVEVVFDYGGVLDKFIGDGMMAVWGTPVQSPDDATRAIKAADRMRQVLDEVVNAEREKRGEPALSVGYGIATGRVIAGAMGAQRRQDFTVIGDTVNLASRLCSQAEPGQVLVCEASEHLAEGLRFKALQARTVKGVSRPVPVFELPRQPAKA